MKLQAAIFLSLGLITIVNGTLYASISVGTGPTEIVLLISNSGTGPRYVLKSSLPQPSGSYSDPKAATLKSLFTITQTGGTTPLDYHGLQVKCLEPEDFIDFQEILPGIDFSVPLDLGPLYALNSLEGLDISYTAYSTSLDCDGTGNSCNTMIPSNVLSVPIQGNRRLQLPSPLSTPSAQRRLVNTFVGCDAGEQAKIEQAIDDSLQCMCDSIDCLETLKPEEENEYFECWFGDDQQSNIDDVIDTFEMTKGFAEGGFEYVCGGPACKADWYAYVDPDDLYVIYLCDLFFDADAKGKDSRMGILVHEMTHIAADTEDWVYGQSNGKDLAIIDQEKARENADNYEYFCECLPNGNGGTWGDPHFKTWGGMKYDFHGICDLVLLQNPDFHKGIGMDIHIRTKPTKQFSHISSAVLRIGSDTLEVMGDLYENRYWINKEASANLNKGIGGYSITYRKVNSQQHEFIVDLEQQKSIVLKTWKTFVRVDIVGASEESFGKSRGLLGSYGTGKMIARDNSTILEDLDAFGQEWQVLSSEDMLFHNMDGPQAPEKCNIPVARSLRRRLTGSSISHKEATIACAYVNPKEFDTCVFDVMATEDFDVVGTY